jgi:sugar lactone lactonase YvrE
VATINVSTANPPRPEPGEGAVIVANGQVWANDAGGQRLVRIDPATNRVMEAPPPATRGGMSLTALVAKHEVEATAMSRYRLSGGLSAVFLLGMALTLLAPAGPGPDLTRAHAAAMPPRPGPGLPWPAPPPGAAGNIRYKPPLPPRSSSAPLAGPRDRAGGCIPAAPGYIDTCAGGLGDGGPAPNAGLGWVQDVALDSAGNLFIADYGDSVVREVIKATGVIRTVAGTGALGYNGDTIPATSAWLNGPVGVALDGVDNLYITDWRNNLVREVVKATGLITTVAGITSTGGYNGDNIPATNAELNGPQAVAVDGAGNVFIADSGNNRVREMIKATGLITTVAGTDMAGYNGDNIPPMQAELNFPIGVAVDGAGNVFIADGANGRVR